MFDPNLPQPGTEIDAVQMRGQLNGLKTLIDAVPTVTSAQIDSVTTLLPSSPATASLSISAGVLHLSLGIPSGLPGEVTTAELDNGLANTLAQTSSKTNAVETLSSAMADPDAETLRH